VRQWWCRMTQRNSHPGRYQTRKVRARHPAHRDTFTVEVSYRPNQERQIAALAFLLGLRLVPPPMLHFPSDARRLRGVAAEGRAS
jgi:hypothetical protein